MSFRVNNPDTPADIELRRILDDSPSSAFVMTAGAGSGKTTSLIKALAHVVHSRGSSLRANGQKVACITYTEVAAREVHEELASNPDVHVSTIHSFLWTLASPFQSDIRKWVERRIKTQLAEALEEQAGFGARVQEKRRDANSRKIRKLTEAGPALTHVSKFNYGVGSDYRKGILGHEDITTMVPEMIKGKPLLAKLVARQFPVIFVDESQDTLPAVVDCLSWVAQQARYGFCLGYFGDPMQKIYVRGIGKIPQNDGWKEVEKPENFRSPKLILDVINAVRRDGDGLQQKSGLPLEKQATGEVTYFVLPRNIDRRVTLDQAQSWLAWRSMAGAWVSRDGIQPTKILVIAHRMAARRLGFEELYDVFHGTPLGDAFDEGHAWPMSAFLSTLMPLYRASLDDRPQLIRILRHSSPLLTEDKPTGKTVPATLKNLARGVDELTRLVKAGGRGSVGNVMRVAAAHKLVEFDPRLRSFLANGDTPTAHDVSEEVANVVQGFLDSDVHQLDGYFTYIDQLSPYSTHQGVKGAEFLDVLVILDDEEGQHRQFSYEKLLGVKPLSQTDHSHQAEGRETIVDRTRRLLYVCASRATRSLAIAFYTDDVASAVSALKQSGLPGADIPVTITEMSEGAPAAQPVAVSQE